MQTALAAETFDEKQTSAHEWHVRELAHRVNDEMCTIGSRPKRERRQGDFARER